MRVPGAGRMHKGGKTPESPSHFFGTGKSGPPFFTASLSSALAAQLPPGTTSCLRAFRQPVIRLWRNFSNEVYELRALVDAYLLYKAALNLADRKLKKTERAIERMFTSPASPQPAPAVHSQGITAA